MPYVSLMNHAPWPHIVRYGRLNATSQRLEFSTFRGLQVGEQCFLSYGPLPNLKLLLFYGFAVPDNPHDVIPINLEVPSPLAAANCPAGRWQGAP